MICEICGKEMEKWHLQKHHNFAKHADVRKKISKALKGRSFSDETKKNMSETRCKRLKEGKIIVWNKGLTKETNETVRMVAEKSSKTQKGRKQPEHIAKKVRDITVKRLKGKTYEEIYGIETATEMKNKLRKRTGKNNPFYGKTHSEENKIKQRVVGLKYYKEHPDHFIKIREKQKNIKTKIEIEVENFLEKQGINFVTQKHYQYVFEGKLKNGFCDLYLPKYNLYIECDGDYWHRDSEDVDMTKTAFINENYGLCLRFSETDIKNGEYKKLLNVFLNRPCVFNPISAEELIELEETV